MVKECISKKDGRTYAVKISRGDDSELHKATATEYEILSRLGHHPNIVGVYDYYAEPSRGMYYMVMDRVQGSSVSDIVLAHGVVGGKHLSSRKSL